MAADWGSTEPAAEGWVHCGDHEMAADWVSVEVPCDYEMAAGWRCMDPAAAQVWVHGLETSPVPSSSCEVQQQQVAMAAAAEHAAVQDGQSEVGIVQESHDCAIQVFEEAARAYESDVKRMKTKIHKYPASFNSFLGTRASVPSTVAIGPRHHGSSDQLQEAEKTKHMAAYHCIRESGRSVQEMYDAVVSVAGYARGLYDADVVAEFIGDDDWCPMLFYDACFLVQYMLSCTYDSWDAMDPSLRSFFDANEEAIFNDVMMLENQIPWRVVETLMKLRDVPLSLVAAYAQNYLQDKKKLIDLEPQALDESFQPPHLLGFLRFYIIGGGGKDGNTDDDDEELPELLTFSFNAIELREMGIQLKVGKGSKSKLIEMCVEQRRHELSLPQVSLDYSRSCVLANMAAYELRTVPDFNEAPDQDSAVCSYLQLLAMIVDRVEDVQELRRKKILQGGGGLNDDEVLKFLNSLQDSRLGSSYIRIMLELDQYKKKNIIRAAVNGFLYRNRKTIVAVGGAASAFAGIVGTIGSFNKS